MASDLSCASPATCRPTARHPRRLLYTGGALSRGRLRALPDSTTDDPIEVAPELIDEPVANASEDLDTEDAVITGIVVELEATFDEEEVIIDRVGGGVNCDLGDTLMAEKGIWEDCGNRAYSLC